ncbi:MAG: hypothetical protein ACW98D_11535 [Promethearchaeota archaeon]|jgi:hypothetical protein
MANNINIKEVISDKNSAFNIKIFKIGDLKIERPTKVIDLKDLTKQLILNSQNSFEKIILERAKLIKVNTINSILNESKDNKIRDLFGIKVWQEEYPTILSSTLNFNPYNEYRTLHNISGYFDYYYNFSDPILLIPNIKIEKYDIKTKKKIPIISIDNYIKFVEEGFEILDYKNKKPIFVPLSLRLKMSDIKTIAKKYISNEFFNIWYDFEGSAVTKPKISRIRAFLREFEENDRIDDIVIFATNIKREIISNIREEFSPSSDILLSLLGANLIGVNREPPRIINAPPPTKEELKNLRIHKARIFLSDNYYYQKIINSNIDKELQKTLMIPRNNILFNSKLLDDEFKRQSDYFLDNLKIQDYIAQKSMIKEYKNGDLKKDLFEPQTKMSDWF